MPGRTAAWVESPLQALSVVEAHARGALGERTALVARPGVPALEATLHELAALELPDGLELEAPGTGPGRSPESWVVGDAFSGVVQKALLRGMPRELVVVDDGAATLHLLALLARGAPLVRARAGTSPVRAVLGRIASHRLRHAAMAGRVTVLTAYRVPDSLRLDLDRLGVRLRGHVFEWVRSQAAPEAIPQRTVLLGSAAVVDGLVHPAHYLDWVADHAQEGPLAYFAHRREDESTLGPVQAIPGVEVRQTGVPVELALRGLGPRHRIVSLPSSTTTTLRLVLAGRGTAIDVQPVAESWWTPSAPRAARALIASQVA